jgi:dihydroorotase
MTDEWVAGNGSGRPPFNTNCRVTPPLRTDADRAALLEGLLDGTLDCIATDHAPHTTLDKDCEFDQAAPGISNLETTFGFLMRLVESGQLDLPRLIRLLTVAPATVFKLDAGTLKVGAQADIVVLDPTAEWTVDVRKFHSKGKNTPLHGERLHGLVRMTFVGGALVHEVG